MREHIARQLKELERYGVTPSVERTKGGHIRIRWGARQLYASSTPTDHRGVLNNIAIIRQWMREDNILPQDERQPIRERIKTHERGKVKLGPLLAHIENLEAQLKELFEYITDPGKALTEEPQAVYRSGRVPSTDLLQYLNETDWMPPGKLAIKWNRPYASVMSALKQLEAKGLAVNYTGVGWKRTPPQAVQIKVKPVVLHVERPAAPKAQHQALEAKTHYRRFFLGWTSAKAFAQEARLAPEEARRIIRELEDAGWLARSEKRGWRLLAKQTQPKQQRHSWGGQTYGVPATDLLPHLHFSEWTPVSVLAEKWKRDIGKTQSALNELRKRGLVESNRPHGYRKVMWTQQAQQGAQQSKSNGRH